ASSMNFGFAACCGDPVIFLDSDDALLPKAVERASALMTNDVSKAHWKMIEFGMSGRLNGKMMPQDAHLCSGDLRADALSNGPRSDEHTWPPTSGNAFSRLYLQKVLPVPERAYVTCPDMYLCGLSPLYGQIARCDEPLSMWRRHAGNNTYRNEF